MILREQGNLNNIQIGSRLILEVTRHKLDVRKSEPLKNVYLLPPYFPIEEKSMEEKSSFKGLLRNFLGLDKAPAQTAEEKPPSPPLPLESPQPQDNPTPQVSKPKSEAYLNRKKGRHNQEKSLEHWKKVVECIQRRGEVSPGDLAKELGIPKSTLIYSLNRLLELCQGYQRKGDHRFFLSHLFGHVLGGKRLVRVGGGKYIRYRMVEWSSNEKEKAQ